MDQPHDGGTKTRWWRLVTFRTEQRSSRNGGRTIADELGGAVFLTRHGEDCIHGLSSARKWLLFCRFDGFDGRYYRPRAKFLGSGFDDPTRKPLMKSYPGLSKEDLDALVAYMASLKKG
jgi:hypothetical protein